MSSATDFVPVGKPKKVTVITTVGAGTFTKLASTRWLRVKRLGGGGGGGGNQNPCTVLSHGGRRGACATDWLEATAPTYAYVVGAGGTAGLANSVNGGGDGGTTTFAGLLDIYGGAGGNAGASTNSEISNGSVGESSEYGGGGRQATTAPDARGYGSGGGTSYIAGQPGGAGGPGLIIVEEY